MSPESRSRLLFWRRGGAAAAVSLFLLAGAAAQRALGPAPEDALPYLQRVRMAAESLPLQLGDWVGADETVPTSAVALLRPNVLMHRTYTSASGGRVGWLFVQCGDARDMAGHYPPICYPNSGWVLSASRPKVWRVGKWTVRGTEYEFTTQPFRGRQSLIVMNAMVMPDGEFHPDMESVRKAAATLTRRSWGAGQVQVIVDALMPESMRDDAFVSMIAAHASLLEAVLQSHETVIKTLGPDSRTDE